MLSLTRRIAMQRNRVHYFRWTPRTARITFTYVFVVPVIFGLMAYRSDVSEPPYGSEEAETKCFRVCGIYERSERAIRSTRSERGIATKPDDLYILRPQEKNTTVASPSTTDHIGSRHFTVSRFAKFGVE